MVIGIDPGWASCGISITDEWGKYPQVLCKYSFVPRDHSETGNYSFILWFLETELEKQEGVDLSLLNEAYIERYVAYKGIQSDTSEAILMFIGALKYWLERKGVVVNMVRAIDWKPTVCKYLVRSKNFSNPYPDFGKKFSILAAKELSGIELKSDHEADAICLSYMGEINKFNKERLGKK